MKNKKINHIFADKLYLYLLNDEEIFIYRKNEKDIFKIIKIKYSYYLESDLNNKIIIVLTTLNILEIFSLIDFTVVFKIDLGGNTSHFVYDKYNLNIFSTSTDLNKKTATIFKIDINNKKISSKINNKFSILIPCFVDNNICRIIEEEILENDSGANILSLNSGNLNIIDIKKTNYKMGPTTRINDRFCYDYLNGLYDFKNNKFYYYSKFKLNINLVYYIKYYNNQYYIFSGENTFILSDKLEVVSHFYNKSVTQWITDMIIWENKKYFIRNGVLYIE